MKLITKKTAAPLGRHIGQGFDEVVLSREDLEAWVDLPPEALTEYIKCDLLTRMPLPTEEATESIDPERAGFYDEPSALIGCTCIRCKAKRGET